MYWPWIGVVGAGAVEGTKVARAILLPGCTFDVLFGLEYKAVDRKPLDVWSGSNGQCFSS